jgi:hypothetical protein
MSAIELDNLFGSKKPKDPNIIRLNFAKRNGLVEGNSQCATVKYKKSTTEKLGLYKFIGWAAI